MTGRLIAIVGPSGVGKDSVMSALVKADQRLGLVKRVITRDQSLGGEDFEGVSEERFDALVQQGEFLHHWPAHGLFYGIPHTITADLENGSDLLVNLSRAVLPDMQRKVTNLVTILLNATPETLAKRLSVRGRETAADVQKRLERAAWPMPEGVSYTHINNDGELSETIAEILALLYPEKVSS